jgi:class 3 adenylate cyclase
VNRVNFKYKLVQGEGGPADTLTNEQFARFNTALLGLGDISDEGQTIQALAAIFDLSGFTTFCGQTDPHLVVPSFLDKFLRWTFEAIGREMTSRVEGGLVHLWCRLPIFNKFLGDGLLFLWDTKRMDPTHELGNVVVSLNNICKDYVGGFVPMIAGQFTSYPKQLRCGIARGQVVSIGGGLDYVGPCINIASRLQKMGNLSFAVLRKGFDPSMCLDPEVQPKFITRKAQIRGVGDGELIVVRKIEYDSLSPEEKSLFRDPTEP